MFNYDVTFCCVVSMLDEALAYTDKTCCECVSSILMAAQHIKDHFVPTKVLYKSIYMCIITV